MVRCVASICGSNYKGSCLSGASEAQLETYHLQIDTGGSAWFEPEVEINETGQCTGFEGSKGNG